jgi:enolase-phosphatase E1
MNQPKFMLLDIEGTTSSISFVHEVLFPYARQQMEAFLQSHSSRPDVLQACRQILRDEQLHEPADGPELIKSAKAAGISQMSRDAKLTGLKMLQGMIWEAGYKNGTLRSHVYTDTAPAIRRFAHRGQQVGIYSSGSVQAQKLFFGHTTEGDLTHLLSAFFDTTTGPKRDQQSYRTIANALKLPAECIRFYSDVPEELDAALAAGMQTCLVVRDLSKQPTEPSRHRKISDFAGE